VSRSSAVLFYDGACKFCDRFVQFVLARDRAGRFRFAPLQGGFAARTLGARGRRPGDLDTAYVLTADGRVLAKSRAVLFVLGRLGGLWWVLSLLRVVPAVVADRVYDGVARVRYRIFGRFEGNAACRIPSAAERARFIADQDQDGDTTDGSTQQPEPEGGALEGR
jgi:predicted DCC family thiol-disulfide oxidoreductase YuxK